MIFSNQHSVTKYFISCVGHIKFISDSNLLFALESKTLLEVFDALTPYFQMCVSMNFFKSITKHMTIMMVITIIISRVCLYFISNLLFRLL